MAPASLSNIPPEIVLAIFQAADDFGTVTALARTAPIFYDIWCQNTTAIADSVLPHTVECYEDAQKLIETQDEVQGAKERKRDHHAAVEHVKRFHSNALTVDEVSDIYDSSVKDLRKRHMNPTECIRFKQTYYRLWAFFWLFRHHDRAETLFSACTATSLKDLYVIVQTAYWQVRQIRPPILRRLGISLDSENMIEANVFLASSYGLSRLVGGADHLSVIVPDVHEGKFLVLDEHQDFLDGLARHHSSST